MVATVIGVIAQTLLRSALGDASARPAVLERVGISLRTSELDAPTPGKSAPGEVAAPRGGGNTGARTWAWRKGTKSHTVSPDADLRAKISTVRYSRRLIPSLPFPGRGSDACGAAFATAPLGGRGAGRAAGNRGARRGRGPPRFIIPPRVSAGRLRAQVDRAGALTTT
eukprot:scaffold142_cov315-Prasinococcus_capsulatus_cf.AAC.7